jgi:hypothetical protein
MAGHALGRKPWNPDLLWRAMSMGEIHEGKDGRNGSGNISVHQGKHSCKAETFAKMVGNGFAGGFFSPSPRASAL